MTAETTMGPATKPMDQVREYLDELLQVAGLDESGNGLVVGGQPEVAKIGLAVNCSIQAIEGAASRNCQLLITHNGLWPSTDAHLVEEKYNRLREYGLNLYVAHDCLDRARTFGTADALARAVRVAVQAPFEPDGEGAFGVQGMTTGQFAEFVTRVGNQLGTRPQAWKNSDRFGHVAIIPGWGARPEWMAEACSLGCDTILSGEGLMFGILFAKEAGLNLVLAGHYATETPGMMALTARVAQDLHLDVTFVPEDIVEGQ
jgi:putative NIF3 family GTP cyclohydrolase 1 type 2